MLYFVLPLLLAAGLLFALDLGGRLTADRRRWRAVAVVATALAIVAGLARHPIGKAWSRVFGGTPPAILYPFEPFDGLVGLRHWAPALLGVLVAAIVAWLARGWQLRPARGGKAATLASALPGLAIVGAVVSVSLGAGAHNELAVYRAEVRDRALVSAADVDVMAAMSQALPPAAIVLADSHDDAGTWIAALTADYALVPNGLEGQPPGEATVKALQAACSDPAGATAVLSHADAIFVGARRLPGADDTWDVACIMRLPSVTLIAQAGPADARASAFRIHKPGAP